MTLTLEKGLIDQLGGLTMEKLLAMRALQLACVAGRGTDRVGDK